MLINKDSIELLIREAIARVNDGVSKTLTARKTVEKPPQDTRHLTDTRTRVSTLLEYTLSYEMNHILSEKEVNYKISNVLWNVFPDLVIRDENFDNQFGLEIKALHSAAEEKSANLHTPISLIRKDRDFIVILIWGWNREVKNNVDITYPHIHDVGVFDAWLIAKMRDVTWLINHGDRVKGIDISTPIINSLDGAGFKSEEGNLGKLMRIHLSKSASENMPYYNEIYEESLKYEKFKSAVIFLGLLETSKDINSEINGVLDIYQDVDSVPIKASPISRSVFENKKAFYVAGAKKSSQTWDEIIPELTIDDIIIHLGSKLDWKIIRFQNSWVKVAEGKKPDVELNKISEYILN